jgi:hypothetical protein
MKLIQKGTAMKTTIGKLSYIMLLVAVMGISPAYSLTISAKTTKSLRAITGVQAIPVQVIVRGSQKETSRTLSVTATMSDYNGNAVSSVVQQLAVAASGVYSLTFNLTPPDFGYYSVAVTAVANDTQETLATYSTGFGVLHPLTSRQQSQDPATSVFGANFHWDQGQGDLSVMPQLMSLAGIRWVRDTISWCNVEKSAGVYAVPAYNLSAYTTLRSNYNIRTLGVLCYDNPTIYTHATVAEAAAFGNYSSYVAQSLAGIVDHFEIWNEPNGFSILSTSEYPAILEAGYNGVRNGNPNAFVVGTGGASPGGWSASYIEGIISAGKTACMDSFSIHPYTCPWNVEAGYATVGSSIPVANLEYGAALTLNFAETIKTAKGLSKAPGIWITEDGWPSNVAGLLGQAQQVARAYLLTATLPDLYSRIFIYDFLCDGTDATSSEHNFGMVGYNYDIRPSYVATSVASRAIDGRTFLRRIDYPDDRVRLYLFGPEDDPILVGWVTEVSSDEVIVKTTREGETVGENQYAGAKLDYTIPVQVQINSTQCTRWDWQGRESTLAAASGVLKLKLSTWPQYVQNIGSATGIAVLPIFSDGFESNNFTTGGWTNSGTAVQSSYKYSGSCAARFCSSNSLTKSLNMANYTNIWISYARRTLDMESDDHFIAEWFDGSTWTTLEDITGNVDWSHKTFLLPASAENNPNFQIRFRTSHNGSTDYAYLDDVAVTASRVWSATISGTIDLAVSDPTLIPVTIEIRKFGTSTVVETHQVTPTSTGYYEFTTAQNGYYDLYAKASYRIGQTISYVYIASDMNVDFSLTANGDANNDDQINVLDLSILATNYGVTSGATGEMGDFTGDGAVNVHDLSILAANYGQGTSASANYAADYARVFSEAADIDSDSATGEKETETENMLCSTLGLTLITGLTLMGLLLVKLKA